MPKDLILHKELILRQSTEELERKAKKAARKAIWTREDMDFIERKAKEETLLLYELFGKEQKEQLCQ